MGAVDVMTVDPGARRAIEHLVHAARRHLSMEAAFLAELTEDEQFYRATTEDAGTFTILEGEQLPRLESFCQHVLDRGEPWVVRDTAADPVASRLAITSRGRFGAYIGVPVRLDDGRAFGTLCCISHTARPELGDRDVAVLEALADILGFQIAQLEEQARRRHELEAQGGDLSSRLRQHELRLGLLSEMVRAARTPTMVLDIDRLRVDYANEAAGELLGVAAEELIGAPVWRYAAGWTEASVGQRLGPVLTDEAPVARFEADEVTADGRILDVVAQRITSPAGDALLLLTAHDITDRRRAAESLARALERERAAGEALRKLDAMRNSFLTAVSHELRTPLTSVRLAAETLQRGRASPELVPTLLERLTANADRLDRLLGDLLELNQFAHGQLRLLREQVRLDELVREAVSQVDAGEHSVELDLASVEADVAPTKVERIVVNLVSNACVHTDPGTVTVRLRPGDEGALLTVEDEGPGISDHDRERMFQPFQQGPTVPAHRPGTGIGLSLVAAFAELHGGRAWVEDAPGGGAAFHVLLPSTRA